MEAREKNGFKGGGGGHPKKNEKKGVQAEKKAMKKWYVQNSFLLVEHRTVNAKVIGSNCVEACFLVLANIAIAS